MTESSKTPVQELRERLERKERNPGVPSLLSSGLKVIGTVVADGEVQLDGDVDGDVLCRSLVVGQNATISGDVTAHQVIIRGQVRGTIRARNVELPNSARVTGGIVSQALAVETGAVLEGHCQHADDPLSEAFDNLPAGSGGWSSNAAAPGFERSSAAEAAADPANGSLPDWLTTQEAPDTSEDGTKAKSADDDGAQEDTNDEKASASEASEASAVKKESAVKVEP